MSKEKRVLTESQVERRKGFTDWLKSLIFPVIMTAIIAGLVIFVIKFQNVPEEEELIEPYSFGGEEDPIVIENDDLKLTMDPLTTQFTVEVKSSGKVWKSCPDGAEDDAIALPEEKNKLQSTFLMTYSNETGWETTFNTNEYSVKNGIYEIESGEDYITVHYTLGKIEKEYIIPPVCVEKEFKELTGAMDKKDADLVQQYYKKYNIKKLSKKDNKEELLEKYPILADTIIYVLRDTTKEQTKKSMEERFAAVGYTYEKYLEDKELTSGASSSDKPIFTADITYKLDGDDMVVTVPMSSLKGRNEYPIYTVTPLPYFGAGGKDDEGFMLVPEGGGALINFNNGKVSQSTYYTNVYGWDMCLTRDAVVHNTRAYYGVYGISDGSDSFICILEDGSPYASIQSDIAGKNHNFNFVNSMFSIKQREQYDVGDIANSEIYEYIQEVPDENIVERFRFVDSGDYVDMAKTYGDYLGKKYGSAYDMVADTEAPVSIEIVGAVDKVKQIMGIPTSRPLKLTTYKEAGDMIQTLYDDGLKNMDVKLTGWCNGGVKQQILNRIKPISALGSKKDLKATIDKASALGVDVYLNGAVQTERDSNIFDGFFSFTDAAKIISKERCQLYDYSHITYSQRDDLDPYYLLHTELSEKMTDNLVNYATSLGAGVSFEDTGMDISSDFYRKNMYSRQAVKNIHENQLKTANENGTNLMVNMGNDYAVPFCKMVTNVDLRGSEYTILDECVPFYQIAVHGHVNYVGDPINICGNSQTELLYAAEYGAGLSFTLMKESSFALQKTLYTQYYGSEFASWHDRLVDVYTRYNQELGHTFNQEITGHVNYTSELSCTTYDDGTKVYVNYGFTDGTTPDGVTVPARDYMVVR